MCKFNEGLLKRQLMYSNRYIWNNIIFILSMCYIGIGTILKTIQFVLNFIIQMNNNNYIQCLTIESKRMIIKYYKSFIYNMWVYRESHHHHHHQHYTHHPQQLTNLTLILLPHSTHMHNVI